MSFEPEFKPMSNPAIGDVRLMSVEIFYTMGINLKLNEECVKWLM